MILSKQFPCRLLEMFILPPFLACNFRQVTPAREVLQTEREELFI